VHLIFGNLVPVILTVAGGYLFARTYLATRSLFCVCVEHALYGCFIFTIGLGHLFYKPIDIAWIRNLH